MSLYNLMYGENKDAKSLLQILNSVKVLDIPRYRDTYLSEDNTEIIVLTRTGGGNREEYEDDNNEMTLHPLYLSDNDASFDTTFAEFHFKNPKYWNQK